MPRRLSLHCSRAAYIHFVAGDLDVLFKHPIFSSLMHGFINNMYSNKHLVIGQHSKVLSICIHIPGLVVFWSIQIILHIREVNTHTVNTPYQLFNADTICAVNTAHQAGCMSGINTYAKIACEEPPAINQELIFLYKSKLIPLLPFSNLYIFVPFYYQNLLVLARSPVGAINVSAYTSVVCIAFWWEGANEKDIGRCRWACCSKVKADKYLYVTSKSNKEEGKWLWWGRIFQEARNGFMHSMETIQI